MKRNSKLVSIFVGVLALVFLVSGVIIQFTQEQPLDRTNVIKQLRTSPLLKEYEKEIGKIRISNLPNGFSVTLIPNGKERNGRVLFEIEGNQIKSKYDSTSEPSRQIIIFVIASLSKDPIKVQRIFMNSIEEFLNLEEHGVQFDDTKGTREVIIRPNRLKEDSIKLELIEG